MRETEITGQAHDVLKNLFRLPDIIRLDAENAMNVLNSARMVLAFPEEVVEPWESDNYYYKFMRVSEA